MLHCRLNKQRRISWVEFLSANSLPLLQPWFRQFLLLPSLFLLLEANEPYISSLFQPMKEHALSNLTSVIEVHSSAFNCQPSGFNELCEVDVKFVGRKTVEVLSKPIGDPTQWDFVSLSAALRFKRGRIRRVNT